MKVIHQQSFIKPHNSGLLEPGRQAFAQHRDQAVQSTNHSFLKNQHLFFHVPSTRWSLKVSNCTEEDKEGKCLEAQNIGVNECHDENNDEKYLTFCVFRLENIVTPPLSENTEKEETLGNLF